MRDFVKGNLEAFIWVGVTATILGWLNSGISVIRAGDYIPSGDPVITYLAIIFAAVAGSFVLAGHCSLIMEMRISAKRSDTSLRRGRCGGAL